MVILEMEYLRCSWEFLCLLGVLHYQFGIIDLLSCFKEEFLDLVELILSGQQAFQEECSVMLVILNFGALAVVTD